MTNREILKLGNPLLRLKSDLIDQSLFGTSEINNLAKELFENLSEKKGIGLAAPQIGIKKRAIVFGLEHAFYDKNKKTSIPLTVLFNPQYQPVSNELDEEFEGCLSIGELRGIVPRFKTIFYSGYNVEGNLIEGEVSNIHARVIQHEIDHLDGILFLDRMRNFESLGFHDELIKEGVLKKRQLAE